ncbi:MarR family winged helix-turn-helix transcriptional regulator [Nioella aestuarii]|uniref:MarR family winged helix-turn-helix transcriptional regulator n=1 Tax=Nioella aestuarii TaxID=1662864 RepID=UPI003D7F8D76
MDVEHLERQDIYLKQHVTYPLARVNARLTAQATRLLSKYSDLSLSQWRLMVVIESMGQASIADIVRMLDFDKGQMSRVAQNLVQRGLLKSKVSESDQRIHILSLTEAGYLEFQRAAPYMKRRRDHLRQALSEKERKQFLRLMDRIAIAAETFEDQI